MRFKEWLFGRKNPVQGPRIRLVGIKKGDVAVLTTSQRLSTSAVEAIKRQWDSGPLAGIKVMVLEDGMELEIVRPKEEE